VLKLQVESPHFLFLQDLV